MTMFLRTQSDSAPGFVIIKVCIILSANFALLPRLLGLPISNRVIVPLEFATENLWDDFFALSTRSVSGMSLFKDWYSFVQISVEI